MHAPLSPLLSTYLDLVRIGAAVVVVLHHAWPVFFPFMPLPWPGHHAVVVFFVLSGLVIAHAANRPAISGTEYALHRVARIVSVAVPALILSAIVSFLIHGAKFGDAGTPVTDWTDGLTKLAANFFYVGQLWHLDLSPPANAPFWSLNCEVWYYALFGIWIFLAGRRRMIALAVSSLIVGPKILLLLPVWLVGVLIYRVRINLRANVALALFVFSAALALCYIHFDVSAAIRYRMFARWPEAMGALGFANQFVGDWIFAVIVAGNFVLVASLGPWGALLNRYKKMISAAAGCTFSTYLYHAPLIGLASLGLGLHSWPALLVVAGGVVALAQVTERQLPATRKLCRFLIELRLQPAVKRSPAAIPESQRT
jgi:peptidoglycan/LPS O-acetylase OafA/YrhL